METKRIICTGAIVAGGEIEWKISPLTAEDSAPSTSSGQADELYGSDEDDALAEAEYLENPCSYEDYPTAHEVAPDGTLQELIDYGAELAEYQDWIADQDYHRSGNW